MNLAIIIVVLGLIVDRVTKWWALSSLKGTDGISVIKNFLTFDYLENRGAAFGMLQNKQWLFILITIAVVSGMVYYLIKYKPKYKLVSISIAMVVAGAIGNLIDRIAYKFVVDFIMIHYKDIYYFPTFNVADMLVCVGTFFLLICILKDEI
ncbi:MAG: signal peptidase II [Clostridium sp.]|uniref:signal peptidase II n=1 Tax=Clostridium sp. TaxID=1506 RepID=UPI003026C399